MHMWHSVNFIIYSGKIMHDQSRTNNQIKTFLSERHKDTGSPDNMSELLLRLSTGLCYSYAVIYQILDFLDKNSSKKSSKDINRRRFLLMKHIIENSDVLLDKEKEFSIPSLDDGSSEVMSLENVLELFTSILFSYFGSFENILLSRPIGMEQRHFLKTIEELDYKENQDGIYYMGLDVVVNSDEKGKSNILHVKENYTMSGTYSRDLLIKIFSDESFIESLLGVMGIFQGVFHTVGIGCSRNDQGKITYSFYDPNDSTGDIVKVDSAAALVDKLAACCDDLFFKIELFSFDRSPEKSHPFRNICNKILSDEKEIDKLLDITQLNKIMNKNFIHLLEMFFHLPHQKFCDRLYKVISNSNQTILHAAARIPEYYPIIDEAEVVNGVDDKGQTPLHIAVKFGNVLGVKSLLQKRININQQDNQQETALHKAVLANQVDVVTILLNAGADQNIGNKDGESAVALARRLGDKNMMQLFVPTPSSYVTGDEIIEYFASPVLPPSARDETKEYYALKPLHPLKGGSSALPLAPRYEAEALFASAPPPEDDSSALPLAPRYETKARFASAPPPEDDSSASPPTTTTIIRSHITCY